MKLCGYAFYCIYQNQAHLLDLASLGVAANAFLDRLLQDPTILKIGIIWNI